MNKMIEILNLLLNSLKKSASNTNKGNSTTVNKSTKEFLKGCLALIVLFSAIILILAKCSLFKEEKKVLTQEEETRTFYRIDLSEAQKYSVLYIHDIGVGDRSRYEVSIYSKAKTPYQRAQTAMKAAKDILRLKRSHFVTVLLRPNRHEKNKRLAMADYAPDGKGHRGEKSYKWNVLVQKGSEKVTYLKIAKGKATGISMKKPQ
jgi:hypothetical protein